MPPWITRRFIGRLLSSSSSFPSFQVYIIITDDGIKNHHSFRVDRIGNGLGWVCVYRRRSADDGRFGGR